MADKADRAPDIGVEMSGPFLLKENCCSSSCTQARLFWVVKNAFKEGEMQGPILRKAEAHDFLSHRKFRTTAGQIRYSTRRELTNPLCHRSPSPPFSSVAPNSSENGRLATVQGLSLVSDLNHSARYFGCCTCRPAFRPHFSEKASL